MAERFITLAWDRVNIGFDPETCQALLENLIENDDGILLVDSDCTAMLGAMIHPWHFNRNVKSATELFWWADKGSKAAMALWDFAEIRALERGATTFNMACQHHMRSDSLARIYERRGYAPSEHIFIREIG